ncbi:glycosyltransferase family 2 protein [Sanguibacter sp. HDW7]|uniref:glycosyltransferase family 2 protein n=1 Tax=Sanguibacter sp. HDW7 TaxID=2714931 RepID=UPI0014074BE1|nr:glycosyltransferase family A protein [Sanguibacter sp. HDW7]QIK84132.1 glycosyltransferase family 2 protein [Sanguibacter sp. HDW7]
MHASAPNTASAPAVDLVIAVHDARRPVARAVRSVLDGSEGLVRVTVVAHDLGVATVTDALALTPDERAHVRVLGYNDHVRSPAGPFNHGLAHARAELVAVMGSDDTLEPGAVRAWLDVARERGSDVVLAPLRQGGTVLRNPLVRRGTGRPGPRATTPLDAVADRLLYRSAPLGLLRRSTLRRLGLTFTEGLATGEDLELSVRLWCSDARIDMLPSAPAYVVGADAADRVTGVVRPVADELRAVTRLRGTGLLDELAPSQRRALAIKVLRVHVLGALGRRPSAGDWDDDGPAVLRAEARAWLEAAPTALHALARADLAALRVVAGPAWVARPADDGRLPLGVDDGEPVTAGRLAAASVARARAGRLATLVPRDLPDVLDPESTVTRYVRYRLPW